MPAGSIVERVPRAIDQPRSVLDVEPDGVGCVGRKAGLPDALDAEDDTLWAVVMRRRRTMDSLLMLPPVGSSPSYIRKVGSGETR